MCECICNQNRYYYESIYNKKKGTPIAHHTFQNMMRLGTKVYGVAKMFSLVVTHAMLLGEMENTKVLFWLTLYTNLIGILLKSGDMNLISFLPHKALGFVGAGFAWAISWQIQSSLAFEWLGSGSARTNMWSQSAFNLCPIVYTDMDRLYYFFVLEQVVRLESGFVQWPVTHSMLLLIGICPRAMRF